MDCQENCILNSENLDAIIATIKKNEAKTRLQNLISAIGILAILVVLICFICNLFAFAKNYDSETFGKEIKERSIEMLQDPINQNIIRQGLLDFQARFIPAAKKAFSSKFKEASPQLRKAIDKEIDNLKNYLNEDFKKEVEVNLAGMMNNFKNDCTNKLLSAGINLEDADIAYNQFMDTFVVEMTDTLQKHLDETMVGLNALYNEITALENTPEYKSLEGLDNQDVSNMLIESLLIRCVYEVSPERGAKTYNNGEI